MAGFIPDYSQMGTLTPSNFAPAGAYAGADLGIGGYGGGISGMNGAGGVIAAPSIPGMSSGGMFGSGFGANMDTAKLGLAGIGTIGSLWGAFQAASLAKKQFAYTKDVTETNLANQLKTYNTGLTDRANNRAIVEGKTPEQTQQYISANQLTRYGR